MAPICVINIRAVRTKFLERKCSEIICVYNGLEAIKSCGLRRPKKCDLTPRANLLGPAAGLVGPKRKLFTYPNSLDLVILSCFITLETALTPLREARLDCRGLRPDRRGKMQAVKHVSSTSHLKQTLSTQNLQTFLAKSKK